ncbi:hypothetical protein M407DRAFT_29440, partial [Tulasnella calospora MUT 4182]
MAIKLRVSQLQGLCDEAPYTQGGTTQHARVYVAKRMVSPRVIGARSLTREIHDKGLQQLSGQLSFEARPTDGQDPRCTPTPATADHQTRFAVLLENLGDLESWKGNPEKSSAYLGKVLQLYQEQADTKGIASVLRKQTVATDRISDYVKLRTIATTALEHCRALKDALGIAEASFYLGFSVDALGARDKALPILHESLEIRRTHGDEVGVVQCLERIGDIQRRKGEKRVVLSILDEAVAIASRSGDRLGLVLALHI